MIITSISPRNTEGERRKETKGGRNLEHMTIRMHSDMLSHFGQRSLKRLGIEQRQEIHAWTAPNI